MATTMMESTTTSAATTMAGDLNISDAEDTSNSFGGEELETEQMEDPGFEKTSLDQMGVTTMCSKRPLASETEPDFNQSKKRRKQSNPVRLSPLAGPCSKGSDDEGEATKEGKEVHDKMSRCDPVASEGQDARCELKDPTASTLRPDSESGQESPSNCPYCPDFLNYKERLKFHIDNGHVRKLFQTQLRSKVAIEPLLTTKHEAPLNLSQISASDTAYSLDIVGSLISDFQSKGDDSVHGTKPFSLAAKSQHLGPFTEGNLVLPPYVPLTPPYLFSLMSQTPGNNAVSSPNQVATIQATGNTTQVRIFNPDAYCELCHKEFCNKYFLKTHKANKHGIYADSPTAGQNGGVPSFVHNPSLTSSSVNTPRLPSPVIGTQNIKPVVGISRIHDMTSTSKATGTAIMKATCDICQKKFCNKYFVRRHKMKMHGIVDESTLAGNVSFINLPECTRKQESDERGSTSAGSDTGSNVQEAISADVPTNNEPDDLQVTMLPERVNQTAKLSPASVPAEDFIEPTRVKEEPQQEDRSFIEEDTDRNVSAPIKAPPTPPNTGLKETNSASDRLRRLGVINADAFCEICCKEYCNKYFLRTHKMKRHGIVFNDEGKELKVSGAHSITWSHIQTSPLNLIVGEQGTNSSDSAERLKTDFSEGDEPECDVCGRRFQSSYLMQMHKTYLHSEKMEMKELEQNASNGLENNRNDTEKDGFSEDYALHNKGDCRTDRGTNGNSGEGKEDSCKDTISEDLQKLQTMILQLNNLNVGKAAICTICNKEEENHFSLRAHMMSEHGIMMEETNYPDMDKCSNQQVMPTVPASDVTTYCFICKKDFYSKAQLKHHIEEFHSYMTLSSATSMSLISEVKEEFEARTTPEKPAQQTSSVTGHEKRISLTPTNSYCEICNKELCNKYFMKTHMQRMHGIEIENGAQIGGVICDICNKELCSKYFLRVHKQNTHGIVEESSVSQSCSREASNGHNLQHSTENDQPLKASELNEQGQRYFTHFTEVCTICNRRFRSTKWLKSHLLNDHGESGMEKWKELENQYKISQHGKPQNNIRVTVSSNNHTTAGQLVTYTSALKIPSNWHGSETDGSCLRGGEQAVTDHSNDTEGSRTLTNLFSVPETTTMKSYHCSYCSFSTPVLAFLFVHEKSHVGLSTQPVSDAAKTMKCPICLQSFAHADVFQHHILTHQFSGMFNPFFSSVPVAAFPTHTGSAHEKTKLISQHSPELIEEGRNKGEDKYDQVPSVIMEEDCSGGKYKYKCSKCSQRFRNREVCLSHIENVHNLNITPQSTSSCSVETVPVNLTPQELYKCTRCEFSSVHMLALRKHIKQEHRTKTSRSEVRHDNRDVTSEESGTEEVKKKLQEAAMKSQVPASYAVPQNHIPTLDDFIMQPFLLEEPDGPMATEQDSQLQLDRKFVPSLVFLPVKEKLSGPLTVSFTLTPA